MTPKRKPTFREVCLCERPRLVAVIPVKVGRKRAELLLSEARIYGAHGKSLGFRLPDHAFDVERADVVCRKCGGTMRLD